MVTKVCPVHGKVSVRARTRRCKVVVKHGFGKFGRNVWCYEPLQAVLNPAEPKTPDRSAADALRKAIEAAAIISPEMADRAERAREDARVKLRHAERMLRAAQTDITRAVTRMRRWQAAVSRQAERATMTTADYARQRNSKKGV